MDAGPMALVVASSALIGLVLGAFGAGGSVLAVPLLVYAAGLAPSDAVFASLAIVGATSAVAAAAHARRGHVRARVALVFGGSGLVTAFVAGRFAHLVADQALMIAFAALMVLAGGSMLLGSRESKGEVSRDRASVPVTVLAGAGVGAVTGLLGVGGGFLAVPLLIGLSGLGVRDAVGTSLAVIAMNAAAGLAGHLAAPSSLDLGLVVLATAFAVSGALVGERISRALSQQKLRRALAALVIGVGAVVGVSAGLGCT